MWASIRLKRREADEPVPAGQPVLAEGPLEHRDPGHQQHLHQQQHVADEAGQPTDARTAAPPANPARTPPSATHQ